MDAQVRGGDIHRAEHRAVGGAVETGRTKGQPGAHDPTLRHIQRGQAEQEKITMQASQLFEMTLVYPRQKEHVAGFVVTEEQALAAFELEEVGMPAAQHGGFLQGLGAAKVMSREDFLRNSDRPLLKERWAGVLDVVGGGMLAAAIKSTSYGGVVTCCGLAGSPDLPLNVYPFILRGVSLIGIDSAQCPANTRQEVWQRLAGEWRPTAILESASESPLAGLEEKFTAMLEGQSRGRTVVNLIDA